MTDVFLGRLVGVFGIRGELKLFPSDDFWNDALESAHLVLAFPEREEPSEQPIRIRSSRPHGRNIVISIDGIDDRNGAEALVGAEILIGRDEIDVALPEEPLPFQLIGLRVESVEGQPLGELASIMYSPAHAIYEVKGPAGSFLVPAVPEFIDEIDHGRGVVVVRVIPGLMEV